MDGCMSTRDFESWATRKKDGDAGSNKRTPGDLMSKAYPAWQLWTCAQTRQRRFSRIRAEEQQILPAVLWIALTRQTQGNCAVRDDRNQGLPMPAFSPVTAPGWDARRGRESHTRVRADLAGNFAPDTWRYLRK